MAESKKHSEFYNRLTASISEGVKAVETDRKLITRTVVMPKPPKKMSANQIAGVRRKLHVSQSVFAAMLNTSVKTVQAWEHNERKPSGPSLRLLEIAAKEPELFLAK